MKKSITIIAALALLCALEVGSTPAEAQNASLFKLQSSVLKPVQNTWRIDGPGGLSGSALTVSNLRNCDSIDTNAAGVLSCGTDATGGGGAGNFGSGNVITLMQRLDNSTSTGHLINTFKNIFLASSTGSLKTYFDTLYQPTGSYLTSLVAGQGLTKIGTNGLRLSDSFSGSALEIMGTASGRVVHAQDLLRSSGSLIVEGAATFNHSSFRLLDAGFANCNLDTVNGVLTCGTDDDVPESGDFADAVDLDADGSVSANSVALTTDTTGNYAAGDAEAGAALTGDSATAFFSAGILEIGIGGTGFSSCTDGGFVTGNGSAALTCNAILSDDQVYIGDGTTEPTATTLPSCSAAGDTLNYNVSTNAWACGSDADTTYIAGQGLTLTGNMFTLNASNSGSLSRYGTQSGNTVFAKTYLASSGVLVVKGNATFDTNTVFIDAANNRMGILTLTPETALEVVGSVSGSTLLAGAGTVSLPSHSFGGDTNTGWYWVGPDVIGIATGGTKRVQIDSNGLQVPLTISGGTLHAQGQLQASGSLVVELGAVIHGTLSGNLLRGTPGVVRLSRQISSGSLVIGTGSNTGIGFQVPLFASGYLLKGIQLDVMTSGTTNATKVNLSQPDKGRTMLSTPVHLDSATKTSIKSATPAVINAARRDVSGGEMLSINVLEVSTTPPKNGYLYIELHAP